MKATFTFFLTFLLSAISYDQIFEHLEDRGTFNSYSDLINVGDSMWVAVGYHSGMGSLGAAYIQAFDTSGEVVWETDISEGGIEGRNFEKLQRLPNGNFLVSSTATSCCDCMPYFPETFVFAPDGELLFEQSYENSLTTSGNGVAFTSNSIARVIREDGQTDTWDLEVTSHELIPQWTFESGFSQIFDITSQDENFLVFRANEIILLDENGDESETVSIGEVPQEIYKSPTGRNFLLFSDGLYELAPDLSMDLAIEVTEIDQKHIFIDSNFINILNDETSEFQQYDINTFSLLLTTSIESLPFFKLNAFAVNNSTICFAGQKRFVDVSGPYLGSYSGAALFTTNFAGSSMDHNPDLALNITNMQIDNHYLHEEEFGIYIVSSTLSGYAINEGDVTIDSFHLNFYHMGICFASGGNRVVYEDVNLQPGDSIEVSISGVSDFSENNEILDFCVFVSDPSHLYDRNELNDISCGSALFTNVSEIQSSDFSLYPNPASDWINLEFEGTSSPEKIEIRDLSGRILSESTHDFENGKTRIDVSSLPAGIYLLQITSSENSVSIRKFVVE